MRHPIPREQAPAVSWIVPGFLQNGALPAEPGGPLAVRMPNGLVSAASSILGLKVRACRATNLGKSTRTAIHE